MLTWASVMGARDSKDAPKAQTSDLKPLRREPVLLSILGNV